MPLLLAGLLITGISWYLSWSRIGLLSEYAFFPLWIGYVLVTNGVTEVVSGQSLMRKLGRFFPYLFLISIPLWWFFEGVNAVVQNWHYVFASPVSVLRYDLQASLDFSTVVPAVLSASFLFHELLGRRVRTRDSRHFRVGRPLIVWIGIASLAGFAAIWFFPREAFPLVWLAPIGVLETVGYLFGVPLFASDVGRGKYQIALSVMMGTLFTGFWWEFWNYYSLPKWIYTVPYVGFCKVFEMPILGYFGYPFFGLIVFAYATLMMRLARHRDLQALFAEPPASVT